MNSAESAALIQVCKERGWSVAGNGESADLVLINTCSVRQTAEQRALGRIALYASLKKKRIALGQRFALVIAGCMAQRLEKKLKAQFPEVDYVMGTASRSVFPLILEAVENTCNISNNRNNSDNCNFPEIITDEAPRFYFSSSHLEEGQFRSFVPIMHGCNNFCSYCIVPYVRGREISRDPESILSEIRLLGERGVREITLLGQNVNSYKYYTCNKSDNSLKNDNCNSGERFSSGELNFAGLLRIIAAEAQQSGIRWLRFLSANPKDFSPETIQVMAESPLFCRHLHLPVQHGSNRILAAMNRGYTRERYLSLVNEIRAAMPEISLSTDILVGFPGETGADLEETLALMEEVQFLYAYMYHFNPREGTAAYDLPDRISGDVKRERLSRVIMVQKRHTAALLKKRIGAREMVLIEGISRKNADELVTRTERDEMAVAPGPASMIGSFAELTLSDLRGNTFRAKELKSVCPGD
jgi:tRNA-2-methylthio-N6-dimethylallyladenosine synthase